MARILGIDVGGTFTDSPAAVSWGPSRLDLFGLGIDNQVYHKSWDAKDGRVWRPSLGMNRGVNRGRKEKFASGVN